MCDLNVAVSFRGFALNTTSIVPGAGTGTGLSGCTLDTIDHSEVEIRQFTEPLSLADGIDVGSVWLGGRHVRMTGTIYGVSRVAAFASVASLTALMLPVSGSFGTYALTLTEGTLYVRPNGLRVVWDRHMYGGDTNDALAVPWSATFYAPNPVFA